MKSAKRAMKLMIVNSLIGAADTLLLFFLQAKLPERGIPHRLLGAALLFMEVGGIIGSKLITKLPKLSYRCVFCISSVMALGGFIAAVADDALQVRTNVLLQDMFPSEQRATLTSLESFTFSVIMIVLSPLAGFAFTYW